MPPNLSWQLKEHSGYQWFEVYYDNSLLATIFPEANGWVWRIEPGCGLPFHEANYYQNARLARDVCEKYIYMHMQ